MKARMGVYSVIQFIFDEVLVMLQATETFDVDQITSEILLKTFSKANEGNLHKQPLVLST